MYFGHVKLVWISWFTIKWFLLNFTKDVWVWSNCLLQEHVFWVVSLNTSFILVFGKCFFRSCCAFVVKGWRIQMPGNFLQFLDNLLFKFGHVLYYVDLNSTSLIYYAAFCPFHIGQFTVILLSLEEAVSTWLIFSCSLCHFMPFILYLNHSNTSYGTFWGCIWLAVLYVILESAKIFCLPCNDW